METQLPYPPARPRSLFMRLNASRRLVRGLLSLAIGCLAMFVCPAFCSQAWCQETVADEETSQIDLLIEDADARDFHVPESLTMRLRILALDPFEPTQIQYKYGGWGSPGERIYGHFWKPDPPPVAQAKPAEVDLDDLLDSPTTAKKPAGDKPLTDSLKRPEIANPQGRKYVEKPPLFQLREWTEQTPLSNFVTGGATAPRFLQVFGGDGGEIVGQTDTGERNFVGAARNFQVEFEFYYQGKLLKQFVIHAPDAPIAPLVIPYHELTGTVEPTDPAFLDNLVPLETYVRRRADMAEAQPWSAGPKPTLFAMVSNLGGYAPTHRLGSRHADPAIVTQEARILRAMGINGFQGAPGFFVRQAMRQEGAAAPFHRADDDHAPGYPVPRWTSAASPPNSGCPYAPGVEAAKQAAAVEAVAGMRAKSGFDMIYDVTVDEIGSVYDMTEEGKAHMGTCPHCRRGFQEYVQSMGLTAADFGAADISQVTPLVVSRKGAAPQGEVSKGDAMRAYWTLRFNCHASAQLFAPMRAAARAENANKRQAVDQGDTTSATARQPWMYPGAMRGNTFLMGGHSLDFFNWYRTADNAFVYETSNRDPRVWSWDSYLCDVGRTVIAQPDMGQELFAVYVKPHRGAPMQRALSAVSRGARYINWYTYGPSYAKGDMWGHRPEIMAQVAQTNRLIAAAEEVLYDSKWSQPARIAVVKPRASELWMTLSGGAPVWTASWENAKWVYAALTHAHLPVDPIDQVMIRDQDLSQYRVIYLNGPALERAAAQKLADWVAGGGVLVTMGYGLSRDEYNQPLEFLQPVLGLSKRTEPEMWHSTRTYGATSLQTYDDASRLGERPTPATASVKSAGTDGAEATGFELTVGREVLHPAAGTEVLSRYGDGGVAATRHPHGQGEVIVLGYFAGLEYAVPLMHDRFDMQRDFDPLRRRAVVAPAVARAQPVVDASEPTIEGVLLKNTTTGKQAITLMNWAYGVTAVRVIQSEQSRQERPVVSHLPARNVKVVVRGAGAVQRVRSLALEQTFAVEPGSDGESFQFTLHELREGDILLLE
ncbi:type 1 glutamine amidotransferase family protein [Lignipirellula cremea]|uniref:Beta-galactosidase trimerization domain protein n=1 Tax=Lignipirellula cremea TaxID=2528010 RepID=A0A518DXD7_9BACT|nr:hypothetical protein [Lignipirellula cremea]QDU96490.1 Beta-galactosidase trimerization domain protein [Lignipirellula cremea]